MCLAGCVTSFDQSLRQMTGRVDFAAEASQGNGPLIQAVDVILAEFRRHEKVREAEQASFELWSHLAARENR